jgi:branched-chain amino acid transport system permease protein
VRTPLVLGVVSAAILVLPLVVPPYYVTLMLPFMAYGVVLLGFNLLFGYTGLVSFGHALFIGIGAYTGAVLTTKLGVRHMELILPAAALAATLAAAPVGALCVRYVKIYFGMLTLAFGMLFYSFLYKFYTLTGGDEGIRVLRPTLLGRPFAELDKVAFLTGPFYYYALALLAAAALVMRRIVRSPLGLSLRAIRENADKAAFVGVSVRRYRFYAFVIAAVFGAVGGTLLAVPTGLADPLLAYWTHSGNLVFMLLLGGFQHFLGPVVGALVFIVLQDTVMSLTAYWRFVFGGLLAVVVIFFPGGLLGLSRPRERSA